MAINEWKIWQKIGLVKPTQEQLVDIDKDLKSINNFLASANSSVKDIQSKIKQFNSLSKTELKLKSAKAGKTALNKNLSAQIKTYDRILRSYEFFNMDENITAQRIKKIAKALKSKAEKSSIDKNLLKKIQSDEKWNFNW